MTNRTLCPVCKSTINWQVEKSFILEYRDPNVRPSVTQTNLFFIHPQCWIEAAGNVWASQLGYKL